MTIEEKITYLQENHFGEWLKTRREIEEVISNSQGMFCVCGRLATGLHERTCRKFANKVTTETVKKLLYLIN